MPTVTPSRPDSTTETTSDLPGFTPRRRQPANDPLDGEKTTVSAPLGPQEPETPEADSSATASEPTTNEATADSWDGFDELDDQELQEPSPTTTSPGRSSRVFTTDPAVFERPIAGLVQLASLGVHYARRAEPPLWLADEDDVANISAPLARIASRHVPIGTGEASDLADGFEVALGVTNYVVKNIAAQAAAQQRPDGRQPEGPPPEPAAGTQPFPGPPSSPPA